MLRSDALNGRLQVGLWGAWGALARPRLLGFQTLQQWGIGIQAGHPEPGLLGSSPSSAPYLVHAGPSSALCLSFPSPNVGLAGGVNGFPVGSEGSPAGKHWCEPQALTLYLLLMARGDRPSANRHFTAALWLKPGLVCSSPPAGNWAAASKPALTPAPAPCGCRGGGESRAVAGIGSQLCHCLLE